MNLRDKLNAINRPKVNITVTPTGAAEPPKPAFTDCWRT